MLRDRLVCGINDKQIQRRLLAESSLDFKKAMKLAYFNGDKMASGGDIQHFPALNRVDERQNNRAAYFQPFFQRREELSL